MDELDNISKIIKNHKIQYPFKVKGYECFVYVIHNITIAKNNRIILHDVADNRHSLYSFSNLFQKNFLKELKNNIINEHIWND